MRISLVEKETAPDTVRRVYEGLEHAGRPVDNNEEQAIELTMAIATANWTNRMNDGLQVPMT